MADSYILNIKPTISASDGRKMETDLNGRFKRVAKKFGGALRTIGSKLKGIIAGGAVAGLGAVMTNPIDQLNTSLDEILKRYDDISSRAKQLGVSSGQLYQATAVAKSAGIEEDDFRSILTAYAVKVGEAKQGQDSMLTEFKDKDIITGFFQMLKSVQGLKPADKMFYLSKIIGEDDASKLAELVETDALQRQKEIFGKTSTDMTTRAIERLSGVEGKQSVMRSRLDLDNLITKSNSITEETIKMQHEILKKQSEQENTNLQNYEAFAKIATATEESKVILSDIQSTIAPAVEAGVGYLEKGYNWMKSKVTGEKEVFK